MDIPTSRLLWDSWEAFQWLRAHKERGLEWKQIDPQMQVLVYALMTETMAPPAKAEIYPLPRGGDPEC